MMNKTIVAIIACCCLLFPFGGTYHALAASNAEDSDSATDAPAGKTKVDRFIQKGFDFKLGHTKARITKNLGAPVSENRERVKAPNPYAANPADEIKDEYCELVYDGISIVLFVADAEHQELLQRVTVTSPKFPAKEGLKVGSSRSDVVNVLGEPNEEKADRMVYRSKSSAESAVTFFLDKNRVTKIDWFFSVIE